VTVAATLLLFLTSCLEGARDAIPFLPPSKFTLVGGRKMTRAEVAYYQKIIDLNKATKINPRDAVAFNALGELWQRKGNYALAKELYGDALAIDDTLSEVHHNLGLIYLYENRYSGASDELLKARALSPDDARIRHRLGMAKAGLGRIAKAEGQTADASKYAKEALKEYDEAMGLDPEYTPAYLEKAKFLFAARRYAEATTLCRTALAKAPKVVISSVAKVTHGNSIIDKIIPTGMVDIDEEAPKTYRQEAAYDLALCLKAQGLFSDALTALVQAEDAPVAAVDVQLLKSRLQAASGNTPAAILTLQTLRTQFPNHAEILKRLAKLYQKSGQNDLAGKTRLEAAT
jgi:tetratricopeptide (TPR) repeat protein